VITALAAATLLTMVDPVLIAAPVTIATFSVNLLIAIFTNTYSEAAELLRSSSVVAIFRVPTYCKAIR
jgi:hypothetical protein